MFVWFLLVKERTMPIWRQNALQSYTWEILTSPPLYRWGKLTDEQKVAWVNFVADEFTASK